MVSEPKKLVYVYPFCNLGGVVSVIKQRMRFHVEQGWVVDCIFGSDHGGAADLMASGVRNVLFLNDLDLVGVLMGYDCVSVIDYPGVADRVLSISGRVKSIFEVHSAIPDTIEKNLEVDLNKFSAILGPSEYILDLYKARDARVIAKTSLVYNYVDGALFYSLPAEGAVKHRKLIWIGKVNDQKNWKEALRILSAIKSHEISCKLVFVTGGVCSQDATRNLLAYSNALGVDESIEWYHRLPHAAVAGLLRSECAKNSIGLITSRGESFSFAAHEVLNCGAPVVAADVGALPEVVGESTGALYMPGDVDEAASSCINLWTLMASSKARVKNKISEKMESFSPRIVDRQMKEHFS